MLKKNLCTFLYSSRVAKLLIVTLLLSAFTACTTTTGSNGLVKQKSRTEQSKADKALVHTKLAQGYLQQNQYATAKTELERALRIDPSHSDSNYVMALLQLRLEQYDEAELFYERAVSNNPKNSSAAHDFGVFLCQIGKERKAIEYFMIAVDNPLFEKAQLSYMRAGECLAKINDPAAEGYLKKALGLNPRLKPALYQLAQFKYETQSYMSARAYIERYFAITKPQPASLLLAYKIESELNAQDVAENYRSKLLIEYPGSKEAASLRQGRN